ncbi:hypothetical protein Tco_0247019 [Tanacetum coccineum]
MLSFVSRSERGDVRYVMFKLELNSQELERGVATRCGWCSPGRQQSSYSRGTSSASKSFPELLTTKSFSTICTESRKMESAQIVRSWLERIKKARGRNKCLADDNVEMEGHPRVNKLEVRRNTSRDYQG